MRTLKIIGVAVLAACALSVAVVAQASASSFLASTIKVLILDNQLNTQIFKTDAGNVECTKETSHGITTTTKGLTQVETVVYTGCKAFGVAVTISPAEYGFSADNSVSILNTIIIKAPACTVKVGPAGNQGLRTITYVPNGNNLIIKATVTGISYLSSGGVCGPTGELKTGEYTGESEASSDGGTIGWDQ